MNTKNTPIKRSYCKVGYDVKNQLKKPKEFNGASGFDLEKIWFKVFDGLKVGLKNLFHVEQIQNTLKRIIVYRFSKDKVCGCLISSPLLAFKSLRLRTQNKQIETCFTWNDIYPN
jgi:hypothetical protein